MFSISNLYYVSLLSNNKGVKIISNFITIYLRHGYKDKIRTIIIGLETATISKKKYISIKAYLGFYKGEIVEVYVLKVSKGS